MKEQAVFEQAKKLGILVETASDDDGKTVYRIRTFDQLCYFFHEIEVLETFLRGYSKFQSLWKQERQLTDDTINREMSE